MTLFGIYDNRIYDGPGYLGNIDERLRAFRAAGLNLVLNYGTAINDPAPLQHYADRCAAAGLRVVWNMLTGPASWTAGPLAMKAHPATWGFYVGDEAAPGSAEASMVRACSTYVRKRTRKPTLYVSRPGRKVLRPFLDVASHVGPDCYPIGCPPWWSKPDPQRIGDVAAWARAMVNEAGGAKKLAFVCQAFAWGAVTGEESSGAPIVWPTADQIAAMRRAVMRRGWPDVLLYFCAHEIFDHHPDPAGYWAAFAAVAR